MFEISCTVEVDGLCQTHYRVAFILLSIEFTTAIVVSKVRRVPSR